jgi:hypothetical protein
MTYDRAVSVNPAKCPKRTLLALAMVRVVEKIKYDCHAGVIGTAVAWATA